MSIGVNAMERRSIASRGTMTRIGIIRPTGPFIKNPRPRPSAASSTNLRGDRSDSSVDTSAAQIAIVIQKVSGRSGNAMRAMVK